MSEFQIEYITSKDKSQTLKVNGLFLHSKFNPIIEAERIASKEFEPNYVHILFGHGLGYITDALKEKINDKNRLIVIDPLYKKININEEDMSNRIIIIDNCERENLQKTIEKTLVNFSRKVKVICSPNYDKILKEDLLTVLETVKNVQKLHQVAENTTREFSYSWQENYIQNLLHVYDNYSLEILKGKYNYPVIVVSGGPSLTKQLPQLRTIQDKVITIASGSTVNSLINYGIIPDYIVSIDGGIANYNHFKDIGPIKSKLIYGLSSHYKIQEEFSNEKYSLLDAGDTDFQQYIKSKFQIDVPCIPGGASVANFAFTVACYITKGPIALIGQDLAYTDYKSHAENNKHFKKVDQEYMDARGMFNIEGYDNNQVITDYAFYMMKKDFERLNNAMQHSAPIYNCTEGGGKIEGMLQLPFSLFCREYIPKFGNKNVLNNAPKNDCSIQLFLDKMLEDVNIYTKLVKKIKIGLFKLERNKSNTRFDKEVLIELDKIDKLIKKYKCSTAMNHIFDPITMDVLRNYEPVPNESAEEIYKRVYNQNKELYSRLLEAVEMSRTYTLDTITKAKRKCEGV